MSYFGNAAHGQRQGKYQGRREPGVTSSFVPPVKTLAALTSAVLLAHVLVLQGTAVSLRASETKVTRPFSTRVIEIKPAGPAGSDAPNVIATSPPAPAAATVDRARKPVPRRSADTKPQAIPTATETTAETAGATPQNQENQAFSDVSSTQLAINNEAKVTAEAALAAASAPVPIPAASSAQGVAANPLETASTTSPAASVASASASAQAAPVTSPSAITAYTVPGSVRLKYNVSGGKDRLSYTARAELLWLQDGNTYEARQEVGAFLLGSRTFTSTGRMTANGLAPLRYSDKARNEQAAHFDRERQRVTFSANTPEAALQSGAQDRVSVFVQLASMLGGAPDKYPVGTAINVQIVGPRATEVWTIAVEGEEKLNLPGGELSAVKLIRAARGEFDLKTEIWLAPLLGYLPARIRFTQANGDFVDMAWRATEAP